MPIIIYRFNFIKMRNTGCIFCVKKCALRQGGKNLPPERIVKKMTEYYEKLEIESRKQDIAFTHHFPLLLRL